MQENTPPRDDAQPHGTTPAPPEALGTPSDDERVLAALAHGLTFLEGGLLGPLVIYLLKKDRSELVAFHALQSLYFGLLFWGTSVVTCGLAAVVLIWPYLIFQAIAAYRSYEGEYYELPIVGKWARRSHGGGAAPITF